MEAHPIEQREPNGVDCLIALAIGVGGLAIYGRTLAPDMLYGDSAEFQALAYTLGMTHSTGYPVYLVLARLLGFLPLGSPAWRVNLLSAVCAAVTLGAVYLLTRHLTRSRTGALLTSLALAVSYTFWSQSVIAEVYTPGLALFSTVMLLLWRWHYAPVKRSGALLFAGLLIGLALGVHASAALIAPAAAGFVVWTLWAQRLAGRQRLRGVVAAGLGLLLGAGLCLLAFLLIDLHDTPTSFYRVTLYPSRSLWGLKAADLDSPLQRLALTVGGRQWQDAMFPGGASFVLEALRKYGGRVSGPEFPAVVPVCTLLGLAVMLRRVPRLGAFTVVAFTTELFFILNYEPPDKYIFYLPTYILIVTAAGTGAGFLLELACRHLVARRSRAYLGPCLLAALLTLLFVRPAWTSRWQALRAGAATFVKDEYAYPVHNLREPRQVASLRVAALPANAVLISDWRVLYATCYLAHVELGRRDLSILEAWPHSKVGGMADTLFQTLRDALRAGRPVYADRVYDGLRERFRVKPVPGSDLYALSLP